jgi:hypothetical protein
LRFPQGVRPRSHCIRHQACENRGTAYASRDAKSTSMDYLKSALCQRHPLTLNVCVGAPASKSRRHFVESQSTPPTARAAFLWTRMKPWFYDTQGGGRLMMYRRELVWCEMGSETESKRRPAGPRYRSALSIQSDAMIAFSRSRRPGRDILRPSVTRSPGEIDAERADRRLPKSACHPRIAVKRKCP